MSLMSTMEARFAPALPAATPVGTAGPRGLVARLGRVLACAGAWMNAPRDHAQLETMDEAMLRDIGLDRAMIGIGVRSRRLQAPGRLPLFAVPLLAAMLPMVAACSGGVGPVSAGTPACGHAGLRGMGGRAPVVAVPLAEACRPGEVERLTRRAAPAGES